MCIYSLNLANKMFKQWNRICTNMTLVRAEHSFSSCGNRNETLARKIGFKFLVFSYRRKRVPLPRRCAVCVVCYILISKVYEVCASFLSHSNAQTHSHTYIPMEAAKLQRSYAYTHTSDSIHGFQLREREQLSFPSEHL